MFTFLCGQDTLELDVGPRARNCSIPRAVCSELDAKSPVFHAVVILCNDMKNTKCTQVLIGNWEYLGFQSFSLEFQSFGDCREVYQRDFHLRVPCDLNTS